MLHQRTGAPYPTRATGEDWYLRLDGAGADRTIEARSRKGDTSSVLSQVVVGSRLSTIAGRPALVAEDGGRPVAVYTDLEPGLSVFSEVRNDLPATLQVLGSLTELPRTDRRLDDLALKESHEDKRH